MRPRPLALTCALLTAALVSGVGSLQGREADRKRLQGLVVVGDSVLAGVRSGGLVRRGQAQGAASLVARAGGVRLPRPAIASPGLPAPLVLVDDDRDGRLDPGEVRRSTARLGAPQGSRRRARNLAVPGESLTTVFESIGRAELRAAAEADPVAAGRLYQKLRVLGDPGPGASVSQPSRVRDLSPSFALVWIGNDDLLDVAAGVLPDRRRLPPSQFGELFRRLLDEIADAGADMAVATLPDPTRLPALRGVGTDVSTCRARDGVHEPVDPDALVSLYLDPALLPSPPCARVLTPGERAELRATVEAYNAEIVAAAAEVEGSRGVSAVLVDLFAAYERWHAEGADVDGDGAADVTTSYLGGFFSLDGMHPGRTGNALVANAFIQAINARFGDSMPLVDVQRAWAGDPLARRRGPATPPIGLIADGTAPDGGTRRAIAERIGVRTFGRRASEIPAIQPLMVPATGYRASSGLETGSNDELDLQNNCAVVSSPVCTGQRACQMQNATLPAATVSSLIQSNEVYIRAYHRVNVAQNPSPTEACSPILGMDQNQGLPLCSADVCVQPDGRVRYRLRDRVNGSTGTTIGSPTAIMPAEWRRIEMRTRIGGGANDDGCELRLDGVTVASSDTLNLGNLRGDLGFLTNRQGAYSQPANPGSWVATFDDVALTEGGWAGPGRIIARQGRSGTPTFNQFTLTGASPIDVAWSNTPPNTNTAATSPSSGDPLAQTMLVTPFDQGVHAMRPTSSIAACQTWLTTRTTSTPNRVYSVRRRIDGANIDTQLLLIQSFEQTMSDGLSGGFWTSPLASLNGAEIGALKAGGASGAAMRVGDAWLACEYRPAIGESNCSSGPPPGGTANVRFYGTQGSTCAVPNRCDRIRMLVDPPTPVDVGAASFTVELWVRGDRQDNDLVGTFRPADTTSATVDWTEGNIIVDRDVSGNPAAGGGDWGASIHRAGDVSGPAVIRFGVADTDGVGAAQMTIQGSTDVLDGAWHHVALVRDVGAGRLRIYVDGVLDYESAAGAPGGNLSYPNGSGTAPEDPTLVFGAQKHGLVPGFSGQMDDIRVWSAVRTAQEIADFRFETLPGDTPSLVLSLRLEEGTGTAIADATGGNVATLHNGMTGDGEWVAGGPTPPTTTTSTSTTTTSSTAPTLPPTTTSTVFGATTTTTLPPSAGLVAAYGFEENNGTSVADASGNGNGGVATATTWTTAGRFGNALVFDSASSSWVTVADSASLDLTAGMTLEAWVFPTAALNGWRGVISKEQPGGIVYYLYANGIDGPATGIFAGGIEQSLFGSGFLTANVWTHLAATYDGSQQRLYVNGTEIASRAQTGSIGVSAAPLRIGGNAVFGEFFTGRIDEVRVYNRALSAAEILSDMGRAVVSAPTTTTSSSTSTSTSSTTTSTAQPTTTSSTSSSTTSTSSSTTSTAQPTTTSSTSSSTTSTSSSTTSTAQPTTTSSTSSSTTSTSTSSTSSTSSTTSSTSTSSTTSSTLSPTAGLVAAYGFEEPTGNSVVDASGTGNGGTISNATRTTAGRIGSALTFNGTNSWVTVADAPSLDLTTAMTIEAWVFPTGNLTNWRNVVGKERPGGVAYYLYSRVNNGRPAGGIVTGNSERTLFGPSAIPVNAWTHLAATFDGTILRMYVNGVQVSTRSQTGTIAVSASPLRLGGNSPFGEFFAGRIDEVRIYNRVLTAEQITADMTRPVP